MVTELVTDLKSRKKLNIHKQSRMRLVSVISRPVTTVLLGATILGYSFRSLKEELRMFRSTLVLY